MRQRSKNQTGIVIRRLVTPTGDIICTLLGPAGKFKGIARGGLRGPLANKLSLFHHVQVQLYQKPTSDLATIQQAMLEGALPNLAQPERHNLAHFIAELSDLLFLEDDQSDAVRVFDYLASALRGIASQPDPELVGLVMALRLLNLAGFAPNTSSCARCSATPQLLTSQGELLCVKCASRDQDQHSSAPALDFWLNAAKRNIINNMQVQLIDSQRALVWSALARHLQVQKLGKIKSLANFL